MCVRVYVALCFVVFLCSPYHLWVFSPSALEPLSISSRGCLCSSLQKMASSVTLPAPLWGDHNDEQARTPWHMHFTSPAGPIRSSMRAVSGLAFSARSAQSLCSAPHMPSQGCWCCQAPRPLILVPQLVRVPPEFPGGPEGAFQTQRRA